MDDHFLLNRMESHFQIIVITVVLCDIPWPLLKMFIITSLVFYAKEIGQSSKDDFK